MPALWIARLCVCVPGRGIIAARSPRQEEPLWKFPGGKRKINTDYTWRMTASRSTYMETGILIPPARITLVAKIEPTGTGTYLSETDSYMVKMDTYIGYAIVLEADLVGFGPRPGVEEEACVITHDEFLHMDNFLEPYRKIVEEARLFRW